MPFALRSKLINIMKLRMSSLDFQPSSYCEHRLEQIIQHGIERMVTNNANKRMDKVYLAERNLQHLVDYLCDFAKDLGTYPGLEENEIEVALLERHPMWPFS